MLTKEERKAKAWRAWDSAYSALENAPPGMGERPYCELAKAERRAWEDYRRAAGGDSVVQAHRPTLSGPDGVEYDRRHGTD